MTFLSLTKDQLLQIILLPLIFAAVGVLAKKLGRRDGETVLFVTTGRSVPALP